ncbi:hypothetical protein, partial [Methylophaga sp. UBA3996]|uniref:hypothetical protein n=1 Tax=Methylophaga sp. UBA3996 TaxID=1946891 RepID=UPI0025A1A4A1
ATTGMCFWGGGRMIVKVSPGQVTMSDWNIVIVQYKGDEIEKFLGYCYERQNIRFSSKVITYGPKSNTGKTLSSSEYFFLVRPGLLHLRRNSI